MTIERRRIIGRFRTAAGLLLVVGATAVPAARAAWFKELPEAPVIAELGMNTNATQQAWSLGPGFTIVRDELLGRDVLERNGGPWSWVRSREAVQGPCEIVARLRFTDASKSYLATLACGATGPDAAPESAASISATVYPAWSPKSMRISASFGTTASAAYLNQPAVIKDDISKVRLAIQSVYFGERFQSISPVEDEALRTELEAAMSQVPMATNTWFELRLRIDADSIRMYRDGFLIAERTRAGFLGGDVHLRLTEQIRIGSLVVRKLDARPPRYEPVPIDDQCNAATIGAAALQPDALPAAGCIVDVQGIPFDFSDRPDGRHNVDIGASLFHYRNAQGHFIASETWPAPQSLDPGRLRFAVPNRPYTRMWLIAAADGEPNSVPRVTVRFYRPGAGFPVDAAADVPALAAKEASAGARRLPVALVDGGSANLWLVPIDLDAVKIASEFRDEDFLSIELTKQVLPYRTTPDPANYSWFQGGLPSGVHVLAMTLESAPVRMIATGNRWGNAYVAPEQPVWQVSLENLGDTRLEATVRVAVTDPDGRTNDYRRAVVLDGRGATRIDLPIATTIYGLHGVRTELALNGARTEPGTFVQQGALVQLPPDTRNATAANTRWGLYNWVGGHGTNPDAKETLYINRAAGARFGGSREIDERRQWGVVTAPQHLLYGPTKWAEADPYDQAEYDKYSEEIGKQAAAVLEKTPDVPSFSIFTETAISPMLTYGVPPEYLGQGEYQMNEDEQKRFRAFMVTFKCAAEGVRKFAPKAKIALGWCEPYFAAPFLKAGVTNALFDWIGVDSPQFERLPEMPIREVAPNRMWLLKQAMKKYGYEKVPVIHTESYYPSSHPLALGWRASADSVVRTAVLSLALGTTTFASCWTLQDCANYWGSQHYGCIGILGRQPEANPKPSFAAFATMTRMLDAVQFDGYVPTGSFTAYCVRFAAYQKKIYCLWTVRGSRPATVTFAKENGIARVDENGNTSSPNFANLAAAFTLSPTPFWIETPAESAISNLTLGAAAYTNQPGPHTKVLDLLDAPWTYDASEYGSYATNHWGAPRFAGPMQSAAVASPERGGNVWQVTLDKPAVERPLGAWYGVFTPPQPIAIPGRARALGVWANGHSDWGRVVYEIQDAKGEIWQSVGTKDDWNCDDIHSWSYFNYDGWRYLEFPLPNHEPADNYRGADTVWWNHNAEGVVDLPVKLTRLIIEHRTHNIYVDQLVEVPDRSVQLSRLIAVYDGPESMTDAPVALQLAAANAIHAPVVDLASLPNPIAGLAVSGIGAATPMTKVAPPDHGYDGTRVEVTLQPVDGAKEYRVYVSAHANGAGAQQMGKSETPLVLATRLRAEFPLYLYATYLDKDGKESKPTEARRVLLKDDFPMK